MDQARCLRIQIDAQGYCPREVWIDLRLAHHQDMIDRRSGFRALRMAKRNFRRTVVVTWLRWWRRLWRGGNHTPSSPKQVCRTPLGGGHILEIYGGTDVEWASASD